MTIQLKISKIWRIIKGEHLKFALLMLAYSKNSF